MQIGNLFTIPSCVAIATLLLAGCAPAAAPAPTPTREGTIAPPLTGITPTPKAAAAGPKYGGMVTRALNRDVASFDLQREQGGDASSTIFNVYQGLVRIHPIEHEKIVSELAEKWEIAPDGKTYTFTFFKGIKWHDGQPMTMEDVKYSLDRMQNPKAFKTISPRGEGLLAAMDTAEIARDDTIKITTKFPSASFLLNIASGWVAIEPKHILTAKGDMRRDLVGTGPFKLKEYNQDVSLELSKNADYHIKGSPYLDGIKFYALKDDATRFSAFRTGKVQVTCSGSKGLTPSEVEILSKEAPDKVVVYDHDSQMRWAINFNLQRKPWDDVRVRKAVDLAFDRQAAIKVNGKGYVGSIYVAPWGMKPEEAAKLPGSRQPKDADIAEARRLLAEAGFPNGFKTSILGRPGGAFERQAVVAKDQLAKIGIDAELSLLEPAMVTERLGRRAFDLVSYNWLENTGDPDETLYTYYATGGGRNFGDFSNKKIDELIEKQARTVDAKARGAVLTEIEKISLDEVPMVIVFWDLYQTGAWKEVKSFSPGPGFHAWGKLDHLWLSK